MATSDQRRHGYHSIDSLRSTIDLLPEAATADLYWDDPDEGFVSEVGTHKAVFNPEGNGLFGVVTDDYTVVNPTEFLSPLADELTDRDRHDIEGDFKTFEDGARGVGTMLFNTETIYPPDRDRSDEPVRCGLSIRWSHDGGISVSASGFAQDGMCANTMRRVTDSIYVRHTGDVESRVDWRGEWSNVLQQLGVFAERLADVIESAIEFELLDLDLDPFGSDWIETTDPQQAIENIPLPPGVTERDRRGLHGLYDHLGLPKYLALAATDRLLWRLSQQDDPTSVTAWAAYSAGTYALTHAARFDSFTSSDDDYQRRVADLLLNPHSVLETCEQSIERALAPDTDQDRLMIAGANVEPTVGEALTEYEQRQEALQSAMDSE